MSNTARPPFVDASYAAELLGVNTIDVLDWVEEGKLNAYGGAPRNPFVRMSEIESLGKELGRDLSEPPTKRRATQNPIRRVELRIRHDAKWSEVNAEDIRSWARGLDASMKQGALQVVTTSLDRLNFARTLLEVKEESEG
jgi:hypothetical protein